MISGFAVVTKILHKDRCSYTVLMDVSKGGEDVAEIHASFFADGILIYHPVIDSYVSFQGQPGKDSIQIYRMQPVPETIAENCPAATSMIWGAIRSFQEKTSATIECDIWDTVAKAVVAQQITVTWPSTPSWQSRCKGLNRIGSSIVVFGSFESLDKITIQQYWIINSAVSPTAANSDSPTKRKRFGKGATSTARVTPPSSPLPKNTTPISPEVRAGLSAISNSPQSLSRLPVISNSPQSPSRLPVIEKEVVEITNDGEDGSVADENGAEDEYTIVD
jgi:hypothetical protein